MKKNILTVLFMAAATTLSAQINGIDNDNRFGVGEDSINCIQQISICGQNTKNNDFATAYPAWKELFTKYPVARVDT